MSRLQNLHLHKAHLRSADQVQRPAIDDLKWGLYKRHTVLLGADNINRYSQIKLLGGIAAVHDVASFDYEDRAAGLSLELDYTPILDLHLAKLASKDIGKEKTSEWLSMVARYIVRHDLQVDYVMGTTYHRLAALAVRQFGFIPSQPPTHHLPADLRDGIWQISMARKTNPANHFASNKPTIVFKSKNHFLADHL